MAAFHPTTTSNSLLNHRRCCNYHPPSPPSPLHRHQLSPTGRSLSLSSSLAIISSSGFNPITEDVPISTPFVLLAAVVLAVLAQSWINSMLGGDQGLGAFLSDGSGYNKSGFKPRKKNEEEASDPLPWLKLPEFDYVDVAGQPKKPKLQQLQKIQSDDLSDMSRDSRNEAEIVSRLELLFAEMKKEVDNDNLIEAKRIELELEKIMEEEGYNFSTKQK